MTSDISQLVERVKRRLRENENPCEIAGPVSESTIDAAELALGVTFPPSYRTFLRTFGGIAIPPHLGVVHDFVGATDVVAKTLAARTERKLNDNLIVVGLGAQHQEWFCLDVSRTAANGEAPVLMYDARDNALDQQFYDDFGQMLEEVMGFVADSLEQPLD